MTLFVRNYFEAVSERCLTGLFIFKTIFELLGTFFVMLENLKPELL